MDKDQLSYANIEDLVSPWDLIASWSIYSRKKHIEESFTMVIEVNNYIKQFWSADSSVNTDRFEMFLVPFERSS